MKRVFVYSLLALHIVQILKCYKCKLNYWNATINYELVWVIIVLIYNDVIDPQLLRHLSTLLLYIFRFLYLASRGQEKNSWSITRKAKQNKIIFKNMKFVQGNKTKQSILYSKTYMYVECFPEVLKSRLTYIMTIYEN